MFSFFLWYGNVNIQMVLHTLDFISRCLYLLVGCDSVLSSCKEY